MTYRTTDEAVEAAITDLYEKGHIDHRQKFLFPIVIKDALALVATPRRDYAKERREKPAPAGDAGLLPCPFCGGPAAFAQNEDPADEDGARWDAECRSCCCQTAVYATKEEAAEHWNTRAPRPSLADDPQAVERAAALLWGRGWQRLSGAPPETPAAYPLSKAHEKDRIKYLRNATDALRAAEAKP